MSTTSPGPVRQIFLQLITLCLKLLLRRTKIQLVRPQRWVLVRQPEIRLADCFGGNVFACFGFFRVGVCDGAVGDGVLNIVKY
jgi:hypothetical protein